MDTHIPVEFRCTCGFTTDSLTGAWEHIRLRVDTDSFYKTREQRMQAHNMEAVGMNRAATHIGQPA